MALNDIKLVNLKQDDVVDMLRIERKAYPTDPWTLDNFLGELNRPFTLALGLKNGPNLLGYCLAWILGDEVHLLNIAVDDQYRNLGLGQLLLKALLTAGRRKKAATVLLEVRPSNEEALAVYRKFNFQVVGRRPGYYSDSGEDALLMTLIL